ncbi:MAG: adenylate/guanylate cyclase domain-containing protein [Candidatus Rokuibacteriota bacterium]|nr:MAG: adenylate/guanylate cyclase domain-containing protein [Candidatus Rokubacteria bacterium]
MSTLFVRRLRLGAAFVLLTYVCLHFVNHALGIVSLDAMAAGRWWFLALWRSAPGTLALYGAIAVHGLLALWLLYERRTLRMPLWEAAQYGLGLALPALLVVHVVGTRIAWWRFGADDPYPRIVYFLWLQAPEHGARQALTLVLAWLHACLGVHYWLRFRAWYPRARPWLFAVALLLPALALLGFVAAAREVTALARTPGWTEAMLRAAHAPGSAEAARLLAIRRGFLGTYLIALVGVSVARGVRRLLERRRSIRITYPNGRVAVAPAGFTILDASRLAGIPHASVCGGRGRCSTCRVRIAKGLDALPAPTEVERRVLARVGAAPDVRLACQTRPAHDVVVEPLLAPSVTPADAFGADLRQGREQELAVLFADLRGFTRMAEHKLPYDVVFVLNRYFEAVGTAITRAGGVTNQFTGDGVMALFGIESGPATGSRQALTAARAMVEGVEALSAELAGDLPTPLRIGIGIHTGPAVVGRMGWGESVYLTAVGDTVHVAARLEQATKDYAAELVVSDDVARRAGLDLSRFPGHDVAVRNRAGRIAIRVIDRAANLPTM